MNYVQKAIINELEFIKSSGMKDEKFVNLLALTIQDLEEEFKKGGENDKN